MTYAGVDGCKGGWFAVMLTEDAGWDAEVFPDVSSLWKRHSRRAKECRMEDLSDARKLLKGLFRSQQLAVLATQSGGQPYGNLVAFAETDDLKQIVFVTSRNTQKYANVSGDRRVALLIDSRRNQVSDFERASAVTAIGAAEEVTGKEREFLARVYAAKHPHLAEFMRRADSAVVKVTPSDYIVAGFDKTQRVRVGD